MPLNPGSKLGPYQILSPLGAGGMGEVYRARDTRLGRDVAVKVLPQHLSSNSEVRARFEREAKTVSSLNHPNICTLFDVGRDGDTDYLVMELVDGETLAARLLKGPLPTSEVLRTGAQIADALDRAHRAGVVHRDLKPGNVMLTKGGAKLMDFGLARATGLGGTGSGSGVTVAALTQSPTMAQPLTAEGTIVGTFQYMSPEQLEGREVDARGDIWALGCVLYEMTTGKRAFDGTSQASLIGAIMNSDPVPISHISPLSPPALERLVRQCLARDADERWQSAGDVRRELEWISASSSQQTAPAIKRRRNLRRSAAGWIAAGVIAVLSAGYILGPGRAHEPEKPLVRFAVQAPAGASLPFASEITLSPSGSMLAFDAFDSTGVRQLYVRTLESPEPRMLAGTAGANLPFWSPDSRYVAFFAAGKLRKIAVDGTSAAATLCDAPDPRGGAWSKDGVILLAPGNRGPICRVSANGGSPVPVTTLREHEQGHRYPQFLPDQKHFLYVAIGDLDNVSTYVASIDGGDAREILKAASIGYWTPGYLLFRQDRSGQTSRRLLARRFDLQKLEPVGDALLVLDAVSATNFGYPNVTADANGVLVVQHNAPALSRVRIRDRRGVVKTIPGQPATSFDSGLSPDSRRLGMGGMDPPDVLLLDLDSGLSTRLTFANKQANQIVWSPDGKRIAFSRLTPDGGWQIFTKSTDGTGPDSLLFRAPSLFSYAIAWSPDGRWLLALCSDDAGQFAFWKVPMSSPGAPSLYVPASGRDSGAAFSPDGRWVAYVTQDAEKNRLYVQSFPDPAAKYQVAFEKPARVHWRGRSLIVTSEDDWVYQVELATEGGFRQGATQRLFRLDPGERIAGVSAAGDRFVTTDDDPGAGQNQIEVIMNWTKLLEQH